MEQSEIAQIISAAKGPIVINIHKVQGNTIQKYVASETVSDKTDLAVGKNLGRLPLFVTDNGKLVTFVSDLALCVNTADVCRAVMKLGDGKILSVYKDKDFVSALLPMLNFPTTESAIYQALNKIL